MKNTSTLMTLGALGFELAVSVGVGVWLGLQFDAWAGSSPIGVLVGVMSGVLGGIWRLMVVLRLMERARRSQSARSSQNPPDDDVTVP